MAILPAAILEKMRPKEFFDSDKNEYFKFLEQMLVQMQDQTGVSEGVVEGVPSTVGIIDPLVMQFINQGTSFTGATYISTAVDRTNEGSEIISVTADCTITLRSDPDDGELVYISSQESEVSIASSIPIVGVADSIGLTHSSVVYRYHESSSQWIQLSLSKRPDRILKQVYSAADFDSPARDDVTYVVNGAIDMGSTSIVVGTGGLSIKGSAFKVSSLSSSEDSYTLLSGAAAGDIEMSDLSFTASGASSKVFGITDHDGNSAIDITKVNFNGCTSLGYIDGYRQLFGSILGVFGCGDGIEFIGSWAGGAKLTDLIVRGSGVDFYLFRAGAGLTFGSRVFTDTNIDCPLGVTSGVSDLSPSNFTGDNQLQMTGAQVTRAGFIDASDAFYFPNINESDSESYWRGNVGIKNTIIGGYWQLSTESATTINTAGVFEKLVGTTIYSSLQHFTQTADNSLIYDSSVEREVDVTAVVEIQDVAGNDVALKLRVWDDSDGSYVDYASITKTIVNLPGAGGFASYTLIDRVTVNQDDRIELWVANESDTTNVTMRLGSICRVKE